MIHGHGSDAYKYSAKIIADFSSNVWYDGPPPALIGHLQTALNDIGSYPEPDAGQLKQALAGVHGLEPENVLVTNGSAEAIYLLAEMLPKTNTVIFEPTFSEYGDACTRAGHTIKRVKRDELDEYGFLPNAVFWICNPNNPDGHVLPPSTLEIFLKTNPTSLFVVDEAYVDLCTEECSAISLLTTHKNLIILKSHTKAYAIPGIRLGYVLASAELIGQLASKLFPWNVNTLAIEAGLYICNHYTELAPSTHRIQSEMAVWRSSLEKLEMLSVWPSKTNYVLCKLNRGVSDVLKDYLVNEHGLLIRNASNFYGLNDKFIRLALQKPEFNQLLIEAIKQYESE